MYLYLQMLISPAVCVTAQGTHILFANLTYLYQQLLACNKYIYWLSLPLMLWITLRRDEINRKNAETRKRYDTFGALSTAFNPFMLRILLPQLFGPLCFQKHGVLLVSIIAFVLFYGNSCI